MPNSLMDLDVDFVQLTRCRLGLSRRRRSRGTLLRDHRVAISTKSPGQLSNRMNSPSQEANKMRLLRTVASAGVAVMLGGLACAEDAKPPVQAAATFDSRPQSNE
ncbi:hypothetical protein ACVIJ6_003846 [Bradyrhizobium sp. USDA 4369]